MAASMKDVAKRAGVSTATVSRVLSGGTGVSPRLQQRVLAAIEELNYQPSRVARSLRTRSSRILGLIISDIQNPFFTSVVRGVEDVAYAHQYVLLLCNSDEDPDKEKLYIDVLQAEQAAGMIVSPTREDSPHFAPLVEAGYPMVCMDRRLPGLAVDTVVVDNVEGARRAVSHLLALGHNRIGTICGPRVMTTGRERGEGYRLALEQHGLTMDPVLVYIGDNKETGGYRGAQQLLSLPDPPTALFVGNNLMTIGAMNAISDRGLRIPEDVALVSFDDLPWSSLYRPALTAVVQPTYELGHAAAELLLKRIDDNGRLPREIELATTLVVRESCGAG